MQEYVEERTVAISVKAGKLSGRALAAACKKVLAEMKKHHEAAKRPHGRQSVKKLMNHYGTKSAMTLVGAPRDFDRIAKEFHVDYAFHKTSPGHYLLFFKADQADAITAAFSKYTEKVMGRSQERPSKKAIRYHRLARAYFFCAAAQKGEPFSTCTAPQHVLSIMITKR